MHACCLSSLFLTYFRFASHKSRFFAASFFKPNIIDQFYFSFLAVKSGDYSMFDEPEFDDLELSKEPPRKYIPDPIGEELDRIANAHGVTAVSN